MIQQNLGVTGKEGTLAQLLARESFFGGDVMGQCTTYGYGGKPGLPEKELDEVKETVKVLYPKYYNSPHDFELAWNKCIEAMNTKIKYSNLWAYHLTLSP